MDLDVCMIQISLDGRLKFESYFKTARDICETCACSANFVFVVVRAKALSVGTEYLELGAKTE